jgi:arylsulfatase A-like enzyme
LSFILSESTVTSFAHEHPAWASGWTVRFAASVPLASVRMPPCSRLEALLRHTAAGSGSSNSSPSHHPNGGASSSAGGVAAGHAAAAGGDTPPRPNIIWFLGDQHRAQATGYAGDPNLHTPNMDFLCSEGMNFSKAVSGYPLCCPFRGALLSGLYPHKCVPGHELAMSPELPTIAQPFSEAGYKTAWLGKWHLDGFQERFGRAAFHEVGPERRGGFDTWLGYENNNSQYDCWLHGHTEDGTEVPPTRLPGYETDVLTDKLIELLQQRHADAEPFFAAMSAQPPHNPYVAPPEFMARHTPAQVELRPNVPLVASVRERASRDLAGYYAAIENLDANLGRVIETLRELDMLDNTFIVFFADHGDIHGSHGQFMKTAPWEESIRIPCVIGGGRRYLHATGSSDALVNHVDFGPTSLGLAGIPIPDWMEGTDYSHIRVRPTQWQADGSVDTAATQRLMAQARAKEPDSALLQLVIPTKHGDSVDRPWRGIVTRDGWKYVCLQGEPWLLFNLSEDEFEGQNLAHNSIYAKQRLLCHERLQRWLIETGDDFVLPDL